MNWWYKNKDEWKLTPFAPLLKDPGVYMDVYPKIGYNRTIDVIKFSENRSRSIFGFSDEWVKNVQIKTH